MLPIPARPRAVRAFELITPAGEVHRYPRPSPLRCLAAWLSRHANTITVSMAVLALIYAAGFVAEGLDRSAFNLCGDGTAAPNGTS